MNWKMFGVALVIGTLIDIDAYLQAKREDPDVRFEWSKLVRRLIFALSVATGFSVGEMLQPEA